MQDGEIRKAVSVAEENWSKWRRVFEYRGPIEDNPILIDPDLFAKFLSTYNVARTLRKGTHRAFQLKLAKSKPFLAAIRDDTGRLLDSYELRIRPEFGTHNGRNRMTSVLSKIAAFLRPEQFVAWDKFAKKGLGTLPDCARKVKWNSYAEFLAGFIEAFKKMDPTIRECMAEMDVKLEQKYRSRFERRVMDAYLMIRGGRKFK